ncbi:MAG: DUF4333 domain-containing protein [Mycobacterium sp.]
MKTNVAACGAALAVVGLLGSGLTGCSAKVETKVTKSVSGADLQQKLTDQLTQNGNTPKSVTCKDDLVAEVGKSTMCEVVFSDTNSVEAKVTTTNIGDGDVSYDLTPSLTKDQLAKAVSGLASTPDVKCDAGLDGVVGATAKCDVTVDGVASRQVITVDGVSGLQMDLSAVQLLPKQKIEEVLMQKLNADGTPAETVDCVDDVAAKAGSVIECAAVTGTEKTGYDVTLTTIEDGNYGIDYKPKG